MRRLQLFVPWAPLLAALACHDGITSPGEPGDHVRPSLNTTVSSTMIPEVSAGIRLSGWLPLISVIVRTTGSFNAALVKPATATLGDGAGTDASVAKHKGTPLATRVDVDRDGDKDLVLVFRQADLVAAGDLTTATAKLVFRAQLSDGSGSQGEDVIRVIP